MGQIPWRRAWQTTPAFLLEESHGEGSLAGYNTQACKESDTTERVTLSLSGQYTCFPTGQAVTPVFKNSQTPWGGLVKKHRRGYEKVRVKVKQLRPLPGAQN